MTEFIRKYFQRKYVQLRCSLQMTEVCLFQSVHTWCSQRGRPYCKVTWHTSTQLQLQPRRKYFSVSSTAVCFVYFKKFNTSCVAPNLGILKRSQEWKHDFLLCNPCDQPSSRYSKVCKLKCSTRGLCYKCRFRILPCWWKHWELLDSNLEKWLPRRQSLGSPAPLWQMSPVLPR